MSKSKSVFILLIILVAVLVGIFVFNDNAMKVESKMLQLEQSVATLELDRSNDLEAVEVMKETIDALNQSNFILESRIINLEEANVALNDRLQAQHLVIAYLDNEEMRKNYMIMPIYTANVMTYEREIMLYDIVSKDLSVEDQLMALSQKLSKFRFGDLAIELLSIDTIDGKKVAVFNLREFVENRGIVDPAKIKGVTWGMHYFQGSAGSIITSTSLIETFLQRDYGGEWIDGVKFLYENEPSGPGHVESMFEINYR